jgi:hypothetical protein
MNSEDGSVRGADLDDFWVSPGNTICMYGTCEEQEVILTDTRNSLQ